MYAEAKCLKNIVPCSLTGVYKPEYAYIARSENTMCGPKGFKFEPKELKFEPKELKFEAKNPK